MTIEAKLPQGTFEWFEMVGTVMSDFAVRAGLSAELNVSLVERYTDGTEIGDGLVQGIRFDIRAGKPSFRVGAERREQADVTVHVTAAVARALNGLRSTDPAYTAARDAAVARGEMRVDGDLSRLDDWVEAAHDPIVDRTIQQTMLHR